MSVLAKKIPIWLLVAGFTGLFLAPGPGAEALAKGGTLFGGGLSWGMFRNYSDFNGEGEEYLSVKNTLGQFGLTGFAHLSGLQRGFSLRGEMAYRLNYGAWESFSDEKKKIFRGAVEDATASEAAESSVPGYLQHDLSGRTIITWTYRFNKYYRMYFGSGLGINYGWNARRDTPGWDSSDDKYQALTWPKQAGFIWRNWRDWAMVTSLTWDTVLIYQRGMTGEQGVSWPRNFGFGLTWNVEFAYVY